MPNVQYFWWYGCRIYSTFGGMGAERTVLLEVAILLSCSHAQSRVVDEDVDVASTFYSLSTTTVYEPL